MEKRLNNTSSFVFFLLFFISDSFFLLLLIPEMCRLLNQSCKHYAPAYPKGNSGVTSNLESNSLASFLTHGINGI